MIDKVFDYKSLRDLETKRNNEAGDPFMVLLPPPNVTGSLHIGHALCYTLQDILARYKRLRGYNVLFQPGLDHAGIVTQLLVERKLAENGVSKNDIGRERFIDEVWKWKEESGGKILEQMKVLGISCDFDKLCFTMDPNIQAAVAKMFVKLYNDGLIFKDKKLVNWDPRLQSAISDLEVVEKEENGFLWHIKYSIEDSSESIIVATSRPETIFGDTGLAVNPNDERYRHLVGRFAIVPIINRRVPIVADEYADPEKGSGAVKITPAHDFNDFEVGKRHDFEIINIMSTEATLNENVPSEFVGLDRFEARSRVVDLLTESGTILDVQKIKHKLPYSDRSGVIVEPFITEQWFVDAEKIAKKAVDVVKNGETKFVPTHWENLYYEWLKNIKPWCISRQIWWGHVIPAWYGEDGHMFVCENETLAVEAAKKHYGTSHVSLIRDSNVLDTWFSSGMWPFSTLGWPDVTEDFERFYSNAVVITGFDIIFFWVARMMMLGLYATGKAPFKDIYIHGLVRDEKGQKMSKSKGNVIDPLELCNEYGADAVRYTLAYLAAPGRDIKINKSLTENGRNFLTKLWNSVRFAKMVGCEILSDEFDISVVQNNVARWLVVEVKKAIHEVEFALDNYRFDDAARHIYKLVWGTFCDWFLELVKPIINSDSEQKYELLCATSWALEKITSLLYCIAPAISSTLHKEVSNETIKWPCVEYPSDFEKSANDVNTLINVISELRSIRAALSIPAGSVLDIFFSESKIVVFSDTIKKLARVKFVDTKPNGLPILVDGCILTVAVDGVVDLSEQIKKVEKNVDSHLKEKENLEKRLSNSGFLARASHDVVEEHKARLTCVSDKLAKCSQLLCELRKIVKNDAS